MLAKKPDLIDTTLAAGDEPALITKQARELGFKGTMYIGTLTDPPSFVKTAGIQYAEGAYMAGLTVDLTTDMQKRFKDLYVKKYGESEWNPDAFEYANAIYFLTQAITKANSVRDHQSCRCFGKYGIGNFPRKRTIRRGIHLFHTSPTSPSGLSGCIQKRKTSTGRCRFGPCWLLAF